MPKLLICKSTDEGALIVIPKDIVDMFDDEVRGPSWRAFIEDHNRVFANLPAGPSDSGSKDADSKGADAADNQLAAPCTPAFENEPKTLDELEKDTSKKIVHKCSGRDPKHTWVIVISPVEPAEKDKSDPQDSKPKYMIYCLAEANNVIVSNTHFAFAYGSGQWLMGAPAKKALGITSPTGSKLKQMCWNTF